MELVTKCSKILAIIGQGKSASTILSRHAMA
jgi:hypothetical protein